MVTCCYYYDYYYGRCGYMYGDLMVTWGLPVVTCLFLVHMPSLCDISTLLALLHYFWSIKLLFLIVVVVCIRNQYILVSRYDTVQFFQFCFHNFLSVICYPLPPSFSLYIYFSFSFCWTIFVAQMCNRQTDRQTK